MKAVRLTLFLFAATQTRLGLADSVAVGPADPLTKFFSIELVDESYLERICLYHTGKKGKVELKECEFETEEPKRQLWRSLPNGALQSRQKKGSGKDKKDACLVRPKVGNKVELENCDDEYDKSRVWMYDPFYKKLIHAGSQKIKVDGETEKKFNGALALNSKGTRLDTYEYMDKPDKERNNSWNLVNYNEP